MKVIFDLIIDHANIQFIYMGKAASERSDELDSFDLLFLFLA